MAAWSAYPLGRSGHERLNSHHLPTRVSPLQSRGRRVLIFSMLTKPAFNFKEEKTKGRPLARRD